MAVDEAARHQLYNSLESNLGPEPASTLMSLLPPVGWADVATRQDLHALENGLRGEIAELRAETYRGFAGLRSETDRGLAGLRGEFAGLRGEFAGLQGEFAGFQGEFAGLQVEFAELRGEMHQGFGDLRAELHQEIGALRTELHTGMRTAVFSMIGAMFTLAGLTWAATAVT